MSLSPLYGPLVLLLLAALVAVKALAFGQGHGPPVDFDAFRTVGRMVLAGHAVDAYHFQALMKAEAAGREPAFLPWSYPPQFALVVAPLGALPAGLGYLLFTGTTLCAYLAVLRRAAGPAFPTALLFTAPTLLIGVTCGQNGFLTGALMGLAALSLARRSGADLRLGLSLGLMVIKPHLAAALALQTLIQRRWGAAAIALALILASAVATTLVLSPAIWTAFLEGARQTRTYLQGGYYPLFRMISAYAALRTLGAPDAVALAAQGAVALAMLAGVVCLTWEASRVSADEGAARRAAGFALLASVMVSPYAYDYDLTLFGLGAALLLPDLQQRGRGRETAVVFGLIAASGLYGLVKAGVLQRLHIEAGPDNAPFALAGLTTSAAAALIWRILRRAEASSLKTSPAP